MADPVALQIKPQNGLTSLGDILSIAKGATELQKSRATLESDIAQRKAESRSAELDSEYKARTFSPRLEEQTAKTETAKTGAASSQWKLDSEQAAKAYQLAGGLLTNPAVVNGDGKGSMGALMGVEEQMRAHKIPEDKIRAQMAPLYMTATHQPEALHGMVKQIVAGGIAPGSQASTVTPQYAPAGSTPQQNVNPMVPGAAAPQQTIQPAVPITSQETTKPDALGNPAIEVRDPATGAISYKSPPGSNTPPLMQLPPGETADTAKPLMQLRQTTNQAAAEVPSQHFNNEQIIKLAPSAFTGTGGASLAKILNSVGIQSTNDAGADTVRLNHFMALQTENNAKAMGANTDAARQLSEQAAGSAKSPEKAIISIAKINDAYATGLELFNKGMEAAIKNPNNQKSIYAARDFQNQWAQTFDPVAMQLHNAIIAKNKATNAREQMDAQNDISEIVRSVGGKGSKGAAALAQKYQAIERLANGGQ